MDTTDRWLVDQRPVRTISEDPQRRLDRRTWPATLASVRQLLDEGLDLGPLTILVGENGTGKSTIVEAVAIAYGLSPEGGRPAPGTPLGPPSHRWARRCI